MALIYNAAKTGILDGTVDLDTDTLVCVLLRADGAFVPVYEPDNVTMADMLAQGGATGNEEVSVGGYLRVTLASITASEEDSGGSPANTARVEAGKAVFSALLTGQTAGAAVVYRQVGAAGPAGDATHEVVGFYETGNIPTNGGDIEIRYAGVDGIGDWVRLQSATNIYNRALFNLATGVYDLNDAGQTYRVLLLRNDGGGPPVFDPDHNFVSDVLAPATSVELTVGGYARQAVTGRTVTQNDTADRAEAKASKVTFLALATGQEIGAAVLFKFETVDADSPLVGFFELSDTPTNTGDIEILFDGVDGVGDFLRLTE